MRLFIHLLCVLLSVSSALAPVSRVHAHVTGEQHVNVHSGHSHDAAYGHGHHDEEHSHDSGPAHSDKTTGTVVDLDSDRSQGGFQVWKPIHWIVAFVVAALAGVGLRQVSSATRPPRTRTRPPSPYPHAIPLLRGPPLSI